jgi:hypothetical protein
MTQRDLDDVLHGLDGARRAGWAKFYAANQEREALAARVAYLEDYPLIRSLGYWMMRGDAGALYWDYLIDQGLYDQAAEYWQRQADWDGVLDDGSVSQLPEIARQLMAIHAEIEAAALAVAIEQLEGVPPP